MGRRGRCRDRCRTGLHRRRGRRRPAAWRCHGRGDHLAARPRAPRVLPWALPRPRVVRRHPVGAAGQPGVVRRRRRARRVDHLPGGRVRRRPAHRAAARALPDAGLPLRRPGGAGHGSRRRLARRGRVPHPALGRRAPGDRPGRRRCRPQARPADARRAARLTEPWPFRRRRCVRRGQGSVRRVRDPLARREGLGPARLAGPRPHRLGARHRPDGSQRPAGRRRHRGRGPHVVARRRWPPSCSSCAAPTPARPLRPPRSWRT